MAGTQTGDVERQESGRFGLLTFVIYTKMGPIGMFRLVFVR